MLEKMNEKKIDTNVPQKDGRGRPKSKQNKSQISVHLSVELIDKIDSEVLKAKAEARKTGDKLPDRSSIIESLINKSLN